MALSGKDGAVIVDNTEIGDISEWNEDEDANLDETPSFGDEVVTHTPTLPAFSGSFNGYFNEEYIDDVEVGATIDNLELDINETVGVSGEAIISNRSISNVVDGVAEIDIDFEFQEKPAWVTS